MEPQPINPLSKISGARSAAKTETVDISTAAGKLALGYYLNNHPEKGSEIFGKIVAAKKIGSSKIQLPTEKGEGRRFLTVDMTSEGGISLMAAYLDLHPNKVDDVLQKIDDASKTGADTIRLSLD